MEDAMTTGLRFALLGPIRAWHGDEEIPLGSPQQRATLSLLLLHEGKAGVGRGDHRRGLGRVAATGRH